MTTPHRLPDDLECAMPREPWERRILRLVEPEPAPDRDVPEVEPVPVEPTTVAEAQAAVRDAQSSAEYAQAVRTLAKLQNGSHEAAEPAGAPKTAPLAPAPGAARYAARPGENRARPRFGGRHPPGPRGTSGCPARRAARGGPHAVGLIAAGRVRRRHALDDRGGRGGR